MTPYGGSPRCPRCDKAVYAAEQIMGPGRKLYHKSCLTCTDCNQRLDSYKLVEHDEQPYCMNCHKKNFGTRDLRQANHPYRSAEDGPLSPTGTDITSTLANGLTPISPIGGRSPFTSATVGRASPAALLRPTRALSPTRLAFSSDRNSHEGSQEKTGDQSEGNGDAEDDVTEEEEVVRALRFFPPGTPSHTGRSESGLPRTVRLTPEPERRPGSPNKSVSIPPFDDDLSTVIGASVTPKIFPPTIMRRADPILRTPTGTPRGGTPSRGNTPLRATPTGNRWGGNTPQCPRCDKSVFFAEQVKAVGKTWHKACLRCTECNTSLDASRLTEREGVPYCHRCYNKLHGPAGNGYALLGKAGG